MNIKAWTDGRQGGKSWMNKQTDDFLLLFCRFCKERDISFDIKDGYILTELSFGEGGNIFKNISGIVFGSPWSIMAASKFWETQCEQDSV